MNGAKRVLDQRTPARVRRSARKKLLPQGDALLRIARSHERQSKKEKRRRMSGRQLGGPIESKLACRRESPCMVCQRIAETHPKHGVARMLANGRGQRLDRLLGPSAAGVGFRDHEPVLGWPKGTEEVMAKLGQWDWSRFLPGASWRAGQAGLPLHRIARSAEQQRRRRKLQHRAANPQQPQDAEDGGNHRNKGNPARHERFRLMRPATIAPPKINRMTGAAQSGHAIGSAVGR